MTRGLYRFDHPLLGGFVAVSGGAASGLEEFLTRDTYVNRGHEPPYDDLPSEGQYKAPKA
jgi:hypothetical protein